MVRFVALKDRLLAALALANESFTKEIDDAGIELSMECRPVETWRISTEARKLLRELCRARRQESKMTGRRQKAEYGSIDPIQSDHRCPHSPANYRIKLGRTVLGRRIDCRYRSKAALAQLARSLAHPPESGCRSVLS